MKALLAVPIDRVELGPHTAVVIQCVDDPSKPSQFLLDVRLDRRDTDERGRVPQPTAAGFRLPLHRAQELAESIVKVASRGSQAALWGAGRQGGMTPGERP